jgi:hypothetical protein
MMRDGKVDEKVAEIVSFKKKLYLSVKLNKLNVV